jgi:hypothetical protein
MITPLLNDFDDIRARARALAEREFAFREAEIKSRIKELWWTPPRIIAFALAADTIIVLLEMGVGTVLIKLLR